MSPLQYGPGRSDPRQWRRFMTALPWRPRIVLLIGVFAMFSTIGFFSDLVRLHAQSPWLVVVLAALSGGLIASGYFIGAMFGLRGVAAALAFQMLMMLVTQRFSDALRPTPGTPTMEWLLARVRADAIGILAGIIGAYWAFIGFIGRQGVGQVRLQTEMDLARDIHSALVPRVALKSGRVEAFGSSVPSTEVGGDLVDVIPTPGGMLAVVADVAGHGVAAGTLMAMVRAAVRARLAAANGVTPAMGDLLATVNRVLIEIGRPDRFATAAALRLEGDQAEVALAGHLPVLRLRDGAVERIDNQHVPLGIRPGEDFCGTSVPTAPGDLFVMFTDGVVEVDDGTGRQLGLEALESELKANRHRPLAELHERVLARVRSHGRATDDVTLLLLELS